MKKVSPKGYLFLALSLLSLLCNTLTASTQGYESLLVNTLKLEHQGQTACGATDGVVGQLKTKKGAFFSQADFDHDLKLLTQEYDRVEPLLSPHGDQLDITIMIWTKPTIKALRWEGNRKVATATLQKELGIACETPYDRCQFTTAFQKLRAYYMKEGYFESDLSYDVSYDEVCNEVSITIHIDEGRTGIIQQIVFCNFDACEEQELLEQMCTKPHHCIRSWFTNEGVYHEEAMQRDRYVILNYLQNRGYADADVIIEVKECSKKRDRVVVVITAKKGERYSFGKISFHGNEIFDDEAIFGCLAVREGEPYSPEALRASVCRISDKYGKCGYIDAFVNFVPKLRGDCLVYDVDFSIEEGEQYRVGLVKVFGNCTTQTSVILHETLLVPGELFNSVRLRRTEERLLNMGFFKSVTVYAVQSDDPLLCDGNYRDIHIEVEETSTGNFGAFLGFSTMENMFCGVNLTERNFNYKGLSCCYSKGMQMLRGGGEYLHLNFSAGAKSRRYSLSWTKPYINDTPWSFGFDLERSNSRFISDDYDINVTGLTLHASYPLNVFMKFGWHYRISYADVVLGADPPEELRREAKNNGLISASGVSLIYDSTDHPLEPHKGFKSRFDFEFAGLGGNHHFFSTGYVNSYYMPVDDYGVLKLRADFKFLQPLGDTTFEELPIDERFFLGGDETVRGYRPYRLGPKYSDGDPKGGISLQFYSVEFFRPIIERVEGFVFCDGGHLSKSEWDVGGVHAAYGFGARVKVFPDAPPLCVGMGYPIKKQNRSDVKRFFLTLGGRF